MAAGAESMASLPVGERVNFQFFQQAAQGAAVRVGGRLSTAPGEPQRFVLTTTDGGSLTLQANRELPETSDFVEVFGTKAADTVIDAAGVVPMPGNVDAELWNEAVKMAQLPQLRGLFQPLA
eukprot:CAMPEP_0197881178 /NCGR_PEP_ID=MMETSP1439-20131203/8750_1 /TAXON_ID=66791 /ORGANISM="Gonyaulax spinifera, Strain CCMP409" /LENGTH=121 /DNA_ID=CAMNT_0043500771 /DNA_START=66 /DNA_END=431 /DNA_ORIENTATION=+